MKNIQEDIIKTQNEIIEILKAQLKNANDIANIIIVSINYFCSLSFNITCNND